MSNPFLIEGPALISFSGGRTSGMMLYKIIEAHGGKLPDDVVVCFANTGKEHDATLDFVRDCGEQWGVDIVWLEYRGPSDFARVNHAIASRHGEPFSALIKRKSYLPNPVARLCTVNMKIHAFEWLMGDRDKWTNVLGLRADEPGRVVKARSHGDAVPLADLGIGRHDVAAFWKAQPFDLLAPMSNCDLCYLKGADTIIGLIRQEPARADWWIEQERDGRLFRSDRPNYAALKYMATQPQLPGMESEDSLPCECHD